MSIINDALKKTQNKLFVKSADLTSPAAQNGRRSSPPEQPARKNDHVIRASLSSPPNRERILISLTVVFCLIMLVIMSTVLNGIAKRRVPKSTGKNAFAISGVMVKNNKTVALINDEIFEVGETVNGRKILNITLERVDVLENGKMKSFAVSKKK